MAKSYPLYLAVRMRRYGSLIKINPSDPSQLAEGKTKWAQEEEEEDKTKNSHQDEKEIEISSGFPPTIMKNQVLIKNYWG